MKDRGITHPDILEDLTPREIVCELDKYIIGQKEAKKSVAIALRNRSRRKCLEPEMQEEIAPKNIIMIGPTGVGKTEIARRLSRLVKAPFFKVEITKYTEVGYMGRDVESMIRDLTYTAVTMVKNEYSDQVREKARINAEERILDILLPESRFDFSKVKEKTLSIIADTEAAVHDTEPGSPDEERERLRTELRSGILDDIEIEYEGESSSSVPVMSVFGGSGIEDMDIQLQQMIGDLMPKKPRKMKITIAEAQELFAAEEVEKLIDMDKVVNEALRRTEEMGIVFVDEIDKIAGNASKSGPDVSRQGVQRDLLPIVEGTTVNTKYGPVKTNHILFISAGAFNVSKPSDLIPELQGRFPIRVELNSLSEEDFNKILTIPKNSLTKQYTELLRTEGVHLDFTGNAITEIAKTAKQLNEEHENIGARRLHTIMEKILEDILFEAPDLQDDRKSIQIDAAYVQQKLEKTVQNQDLSRYIL